MKRGGILHAQLNERIARLGHTDTFVIGDRGLPVPPGVECVDLAVITGVPSFAKVLEAVLAEVEVEAAVIAAEADTSPVRQVLARNLPEARRVPHEEFKELTRQARFVVRTGEATPYANAILRCGVPF
ncbi:D-ribose pyranase [Kocuria soli]|uniref:D-ribose pyranase n=1 Tax=Kocuria soli TaxID=2485125 RepID=A0A3N4A302_9MICC|nr:D-ribose pyranase [Kocuria soli]ROZ62821.1 D-ribose pyranase [Kocuria soli]